MLVNVFYPENNLVHKQILKSFYNGISTEKKLLPLEKGYLPCDIAVTFGITKSNNRGSLVGEIFRKHKGINIVVERGFLKRDQYYMVGRGGLNGRANYFNKNSPPDRFSKLEVEIKPWKCSEIKKAVVCFQVPWDSSVQHTDYYGWCSWILDELGKFPLVHVDVSIHPCILGNRGKGGRPQALRKYDQIISGRKNIRRADINIFKDIQNYDVLLAFNSNSNVEATIEGIPNFAFDEGSMCWSICNKNIEILLSPNKPNREQWAYNLAYTQWNEEEINSGECWNFLNKRLC